MSYKALNLDKLQQSSKTNPLLPIANTITISRYDEDCQSYAPRLECSMKPTKTLDSSKQVRLTYSNPIFTADDHLQNAYQKPKSGT